MSESQHPPTETKVTVEALLRLKRAERPPAEFWDGFEERLHQRMLREMVATPAPARSSSLSWWRRAWLAAPAVVAAGLFVWAPMGSDEGVPVGPSATELAMIETSAPELHVASASPAPAAVVEAQFVSDLLAPSWNRSSSTFTRVLASEMFAAPVAAVYVANPLSKGSDLPIGAMASGPERF